MTSFEIENFFNGPEGVAAFFGISSEAVYQWRNRPGNLIPKGRAAEAALRTDGALKFNPLLYSKDNLPATLETPQKQGVNRG